LAKFTSQYLGKSSAPSRYVSDFRYVAPFWNQSALKATGVENGGQFFTFQPIVKILRGMSKLSSKFYQFGMELNVRYAFDRVLLCRLQGE